MVFLTIFVRFTKLMKEAPLEKTNEDEIGRLVVMKMSCESSHLLWRSSVFVNEALTWNTQQR